MNKDLYSSVFASGIGAGLSFITTVILSRLAGAEQFGHYAYLLTLSSLLIVLIDYAVEKCFSRYVISSAQDLQTAISNIIVFKISGLIIVSLVWIVLIATNIANLPFEVLLFLLPALNLGFIFEWENSNLTYAKILAVEKLTLLLVGSITVYLSGIGWEFFLVYFVVSISGLLTQRAFVLNRIRFRKIDIKLFYIEFWKPYLPVFLISCCQLSYSAISRIFIAVKVDLSTFASVSIGFQLIALASIFQTQVDRSYRKEIFATCEEKDFKALRAALRDYAIKVMIPMALIFVACLNFSPTVAVLIYGVEYSQVGYVLQCLSPFLLSVPLLRICEIICIAIGIKVQSLGVNIISFFTILIFFFFVAEVGEIHALLLPLAMMQFLHVAVLIGLIYKRLNYENYKLV